MPDSIDLRPIERAINHMGAQLELQISNVRNDVNTLGAIQQATHQDLLDLRRQFEEFLVTNERQRLLQLAETRLGTLKSDIEREYGHYEVVRRSSVGTLQAFDVGNVRNKTVLEVSEELMIQTPRYWLAPALVALAAWSRDDVGLAEKSVDAAFSRSVKKTSLFFALVLRRQGRTAEATRWLRHYFVSLDPRSLTREFAVLLEAVAQDGFGPEGRLMVLEKLHEWRELLRDDADIVTKQVQTWRSEIDTQRGSVDATLYPCLASHSPQWPTVRDGLERASAHQFMIDKYSAVRDTVTPLTGSVADRLDDLLELLVSEYDDEELPLRRELVYQQAIIDNGGDADRAAEQAENDVAALEETIDALSLQTHTALRPDLFGVSVSTQRMSVGACTEDITTAVGQHARDYRAGWPPDVEIRLDVNHSTFASTYGFGTWSTTTSVPQAQAEQQLMAHWDATFQRFIDSQRFSTKMVLPHIAGGLFGVVLGLLLFPVGLLLSVAAVAVVAFLIVQKRNKCEQAVASAQNAREAAKRESLDLYRATSAEWVDARIVYGEEDAKELPLLQLVEGWPK
jgi:hypothetical protein